ncbi:Asp-tRNA(Asn)/Glu-tRNA(Gln) amidotransferase subunit GatC [Penaeicola halotolerans]|uniref:Asp-tRNA(Asn)/Glu-tRNA(Gln) amidotransferase subunit GatC n=1 Tax=Penaeicola halotolerans TaxID=2793196 RepID=UPI001CF8E0B0|nr:Asp-tRNA(Asn)/Glu-tRNA(Gln) amidotransferase subunit GatC [Penaeicola halotolerans]
MKIDKNTIQKIAHLSRLEFDAQGEQKMIDSMTQILDWVEKLDELDTEGIEPLTTMSSEVNVLRADEVKPPLPHDKGLKNAPQKDSDYFRVPKVLE